MTERRRVVVLAALCVLAISLAAATLDSAVVQAPGEGFGTGGSGPGASPAVDAGPSSGMGGVAALCVPWLATPWVAVGGLALFGAGVVVLARRYGRFEAVAFGGGVGVPATVLYLAVTACETGGVTRLVVERVGALPVRPPGGSGGGGESALPALLGVVVLAGAVLAAALVYLSVGRRGESADDSDDEGERETAAARAAGEAAARIDAGGELETEIHRAWREMATHLDVARPAASTPGEFADAAIAAGFPSVPVRELTSLFEAVRYGGLEATADRTRRARVALERIERSQPSPDPADDDSGGTDG